MTMLAFDTHKFIKDLSGAGMNIEQAEVLADHYTTLLTDRIATKEDVNLLRKDMDHLRKDMDHLRKDMDHLRKDTDILIQDVGLLRQDMLHLRQDIEGKINTMGKDLWIKMLVSQLGIAGLIIAGLGYLG